MTRLAAAGRAPRGWEQVVANLNSQNDRLEFMRSMLELQCRIVAAEYGALWEPDATGKQPKLTCSWPPEMAQNAEQSPIFKMLDQAAKSGIERGASHVLKIEIEGEAPGVPAGGHIFVTLLRDKTRVAAIVTVVADLRDPELLRSTVPLRELAAGLYESFLGKQEAVVRAREAEQVRQAMAALAVTQEGQGFHGAGLNLCNELARAMHCDRVSLGWIKGRGVKIVSMSDTDQVKRHSEEVGAIELAMSECLDQQQPIAFPVPEDAEPLLQQCVVFSHKRLVDQREGKYVLSVPLRDRDEWVGVLTLERQGERFDPITIQRLQLIADVVGPQLTDRHETDRWWFGHVWRSIERSSGYLVGPRHVIWKLVGLAALLVLVVSLVFTWPYKVSSSFRLEAHDGRYLTMPYSGKIDRVHAMPGDMVTQGQLLAEIDATDVKLQLAEAIGKLKTAKIERDQATSEGKRSDAAKAGANVDELQARVDLLQTLLNRAKIVSPVNGVILEGDWMTKIGVAMEQGTNLFQVAPLEKLTPVLRLSETDVNLLVEAMQQQTEPLKGDMATRSEPGQAFALQFDRIVPLAKPVEGSNVFEVWCKIDDPKPWLKPGMEGVARLNVGKRRIFWIWTHRIVDTVRLWLWW